MFLLVGYIFQRIYSNIDEHGNFGGELLEGSNFCVRRGQVFNTKEIEM